MIKEIQYTYNVINKTYSDLSLEDIVDGARPDLISFDIEVGNNANLPSFIKRYEDVKSQFNVDRPESEAIQQLTDQMLTSGYYANGVEYPVSESRIEYYADDYIEDASNSINETNLSLNDSSNGISPLNYAETVNNNLNDTDLIGETYSNPSLQSELEQDDQPFNIELNIPEPNQIPNVSSYLNDNVINNISENTEYNDSYSNFESIVNNKSNIKDLITLNSSNLIRSSINESIGETKTSNYLNILKNGLTPGLSPLNTSTLSLDSNTAIDNINNSSSFKSIINDYKDSINTNKIDSFSSLTSIPGTIKTENMNTSYVKDLGVTRDNISIKEDKSVSVNNLNSMDTSSNYSNNSSNSSNSLSTNSSNSSNNLSTNSSNSSNSLSTNSSNINSENIKVTELSNTNTSSDNSTKNESQSMTRSVGYNQSDLSPLENRLKRIERILMGPLDVKIIE